MSKLRIVSTPQAFVHPIKVSGSMPVTVHAVPEVMRPRLTVVGVANALDRPHYGPFTILRRVP
jgi:hypothetical protein